MKRPTGNAISQGKHGPYNAVDYRAVPDPNIYAPEDGQIIFAGKDGDCGNKIWLQSATGRHTMCHLNSFNVKLTQWVKQGDVLGKMGNTGLSTGPHLHWAFRNSKGVWIYPPTLIKEGDMATPAVNEGDAVNVFRGLGYEPNANDKAAAVKRGDWKEWIYKDVLTHNALPIAPKPWREGVIVAYQRYLGKNPSEEQIKAQMGQKSMYNVLDSLGAEVEAQRKSLEAGGNPKATALLKAVQDAVK